MTTLRSVMNVTGIVFLAGCATPKPPLPEAEYARLAGRYVGIQKCGQLGLMAPDTAAHGLRYQTNIASLYTFDQGRMDSLVRRYQENPQAPTATDCNTAAMSIAATRQQEARNNAAAQANQQAWSDTINNQPKQTYCNQAGTQTLCSTY